MTGRSERLVKKVRETSVQIKNPQGLHMRPAMQFVDLANQFAAEIRVSNGLTTVDGKSIMQMSMLAAICGTQLIIRAIGTDGEKAIQSLKELVEVRMFDTPSESRLPEAGRA